jgi:hypothetical protein
LYADRVRFNAVSCCELGGVDVAHKAPGAQEVPIARVLIADMMRRCCPASPAPAHAWIAEYVTRRRSQLLDKMHSLHSPQPET